MFPTSWHRSRTGRVVQRLSPEHGLQFAAWPIQQCRMADPTTPYGRPDVWPGPPRGREITGKLRFTPLNVLLTQGLRPPHMHTAIRKTARSLTCLLRNFCPFIPLLIVLFPLLPVIPPQTPPLVPNVSVATDRGPPVWEHLLSFRRVPARRSVISCDWGTPNHRDRSPR